MSLALLQCKTNEFPSFTYGCEVVAETGLIPLGPALAILPRARSATINTF